MIKTTRLKQGKFFLETLEVIKSLNKSFRNLIGTDYPSSEKVYILNLNYKINTFYISWLQNLLTSRKRALVDKYLLYYL